MPVAAELDWSKDGKARVIPGKETAIACARAAIIAAEDPNSLIIATAGLAPSKWKCAHMANVMATDLVNRLKVDPTRVITTRADTYDTDGEMRALVEIVKERFADCSEIILVVKWWHARRAKWLCELRLEQAGLKIPVKLSECPSYAPAWVIMRECALGIPWNRLRMLVRG